MSRRQVREQIFKLLFRIEFNKQEEMEEQVVLFFEHPDEEETVISPDARQEITEKVLQIFSHIEQIDTMIDEKAKGWDSKRMGKVELTIIRLAVYEVRFDEAVPTVVAINEAVELAKKYGQDESASFVNGVLAKFAD